MLMENIVSIRCRDLQEEVCLVALETETLERTSEPHDKKQEELNWLITQVSLFSLLTDDVIIGVVKRFG